MKTLKTLTVTMVAIAGLFVSITQANAEVYYAEGGIASENSYTGEVTQVTYGDDGGIESVTIDAGPGEGNLIIEDGNFDDIQDFGEVLEKAFDHDQNVIITVGKRGDLVRVTRRKKAKKNSDGNLIDF